MTGQETTITLKPPSDYSGEELDCFRDLVIAAGEVEEEGLQDRIRRAEVLAVLKQGGKIIGVGALKRQHPNHTARLFQKANAKSVANDFSLELGWVVIRTEYRGHKYSRPIVDALVAHAKGQRIYATSVSTNEPMHKTLINYKFERDGSDWPSQRRKRTRLLLFVHKGSTSTV
jgi:RimJ/RimL family protein N-acetyltransferase